MEVEFRGETPAGEKVYGDLIRFRGHPHIYNGAYMPVKSESVSPLAGEVANGKLYSGDEIRIDFDKAAKVIGEGLMLVNINSTKPPSEAKLKVEYANYRWRVIWKTANGRVDTGVDMDKLRIIAQYVEVV